MKIYYKVTTPDLYSTYVKGEMRIHYKIGKWVRPNKKVLEKGYGIAVFDSVENAHDLFHCLCPSSILWKEKLFECEIGKILPTPYRSIYVPNLISDFIKYIELDNRTYCLWPKGTIITDKVRLIREVSRW